MFIVGGNQSAGGYEIANSLRFDDASVDYLSRTPSSAGSNRKFTFSAWVKRSHPSNEITMVSQNNSANSARDCIRFNGGDQILRIFLNDASTASFASNSQYRDVSAWYHVVVNADTTQATASNRLKAWINGEQVTSWSIETYPSLNANLLFNSDNLMYIGRDSKDNNTEWEGYMAEIFFIDGTAYDETNFGEFDEDSGVWKPIDVSGLTFGTNGFYLPFENSAALGQDDSGNGNNFTVNNLTSIDQTTDTPTNNSATLNPLDFGKIAPAFSNGNLQYVSSGSGVGANSANRATFGFSTGKWYWELKRNDNDAGYFGATNSDIATWFNSNGALSGGFYGVTASGDKFVNGSLTSSVFSAMSSGDIGMFAYDLDNNYFYFGVNGTWVTSGDPESGSSGTGALGTLASGTYQPSLCNGNYSVSTDMSLNFGNPPFTISSGNSDANGYGNFEYSVPSGYYALNTKNLAEYG